MQYHYPWIPEGEPLELQGNVTSAKADLVKGVLKITVEVPLTPQTFAMRNRLAVIVEQPARVAVDIQVIRMQVEKLADLRSQPAEPGQDRQFGLGDVLEEMAERVNAGELGPNVTATVTRASPEPQPTLLEAQVMEAAHVAQTNGGVSISIIQRKLRLGYHRAVELLEELRKRGLVDEDGKPTEALISGPEAGEPEA